MKVPLTPLHCPRYACGQSSDKIAVVYGDKRYTYAEFVKHAAIAKGVARNWRQTATA